MIFSCEVYSRETNRGINLMNKNRYVIANSANCQEAGADCATQKNTVSHEVLEMSAYLAGRAERISGHVHEKLHPVMISLNPCPPSEVSQSDREYPQLFNCLREDFRKIEAALDSIENALSRTEL